MAIRKRLSRGMLLTGATTATVIGVSVGIAAAVAITFSITPGGAITAKAGTTTLTDTKTGTKLTCTSSASTGTLKKGTGISGTSLGTITNQTFTGCKGPLGITLTVMNTHFPWKLSGTSYNATTGTTTGFISGIHSNVSGTGCSLSVDGTSATANNGKVKVTYKNSTHQLTVLASGGNLHIYNVSGCASLINNNDPTTFVGVFTVSPTQKITSP